MMTLSEAVQLIMTAGEKAHGGEAFVLKMPVIKLKDLADVVIEEECKNLNVNYRDVDIKIIGLRAGERRFEELMTREESESAYNMGDMYAIMPSIYVDNIKSFYKDLKKAKVGSYNSSDTVSITKEQVRKMLKDEGLV